MDTLKNDTNTVAMEQVLKHRDALKQFTEQVEEIGGKTVSTEVAQICRSLVHASRFVVWLCDSHGIALFPETWKKIASETWEEAKANGLGHGFSREEHMDAIRDLIVHTWPDGRVTNAHIHYIGGNA